MTERQQRHVCLCTTIGKHDKDQLTVTSCSWLALRPSSRRRSSPWPDPTPRPPWTALKRFSSALGLAFAATLPMVLSAASSTPLFVASVPIQFLAADGLLFVSATLLLRAIFVCRASHHLLALAWTVPAPATLRLQRLKPWRHQSWKPRRRLLMKWSSSPLPRTYPWS